MTYVTKFLATPKSEFVHDIIGKQCKGIAFDTKLPELFGEWGLQRHIRSPESVVCSQIYQYWFRRKRLEDPLHVRPTNTAPFSNIFFLDLFTSLT